MIYLVGGSGGPNFGDELILLHWIRAYRAAGFDDEIVVDCKSVSQSERLHGRSHPASPLAWASRAQGGVRFVHRIKSLTKGRGGLLSAHAALGAEFVRCHSEQFKRSMRAPDGIDMSRCRIIHLIGGGYISGVWPNSGAILGACAQLSRHFDIPAVATGLGLEPLSPSVVGDARALDQHIQQFQLFECRDQGSYAALRSLGILASNLRAGLDDSFLCQAQGALRTGRPTLHISAFVQHEQHLVGEHALPRLKQLAARYEQTAFWVCSPGDEALVAPLRRALGELHVYELRDLLFGPPVLGQGDSLLSSRFHPHLLAARAGMRGYYLSVSPFYQAKHASVLKLGSKFSDFASADLDAEAGGGLSLIAAAEGAHHRAKTRVAEQVFALAKGRVPSKDRTILRPVRRYLRGTPGKLRSFLASTARLLTRVESRR